MRILVCGDRNWQRRDIIEAVFDSILKDKIDMVIEGEAKGADKTSRRICQDRKIPYRPYFAEWKRYGLLAGMMRNTHMLMEGKPDLIVAFFTKIENSKGTKNMINQGLDAGVEVLLVSESDSTEGYDVRPIHEHID